jgi:hypothetical protein
MMERSQQSLAKATKFFEKLYLKSTNSPNPTPKLPKPPQPKPKQNLKPSELKPKEIHHYHITSHDHT